MNIDRMLDNLKEGDTWSEIEELRDFLMKKKGEGVSYIPYLADNRKLIKKLEKRGVKIVISTDLGMDIDESLETDIGIPTYRKLMSMMLLIFSAGMKVAFYSVIEAADAGAIPTDEEVISMGGTELGLDTSIIVKPSFSDEIFNEYKGIEIREIICKPRTMFLNGIYLERRYYSPRK